MINALVWGVFWLGSFCTLEGLAAFWPGCPWDTFSRFAWDLQVAYGAPVTIGVFFVLSVLLTHLPRYKNLTEGDRKREKSS